MTKSEIVLTATIGVAAIVISVAIYFIVKVDGLNSRIDDLGQSLTTVRNQVKVIVWAFPEKTIPILLSQQDLAPTYPKSYQYSSNKKLGQATLESFKEIGITLKESRSIPVYKEPPTSGKVYYYDVKELMDVRNEQNKEMLKRKQGE